MLTQLFANDATTTVSSGGTTAPAAGTVETWTVASSATFAPAASANFTMFFVADTALPTEKIQVTNISGTTWTVTRGADGTTPVAHTSGFTITQVITASFYRGLPFYIQPSGDTTGAKDWANITNALLACQATQIGGTVWLGPGEFYINAQINVYAQSTPLAQNYPGFPVNLEGVYGSTVINLVSGWSAGVSAIYSHRITKNIPNQNGQPTSLTLSSNIRNIIIDGNAPSAINTQAIGLDVGDGWGIRVEGVMIRNFYTTNLTPATSTSSSTNQSIGMYFNADLDWAEKCYFSVHTVNCDQHIVVDNTIGSKGSSNSHEYNDWDIYAYALGPGNTVSGIGQRVMTWINGAMQGGGRIFLHGNVGGDSLWSYAATHASPCVFTITGNSYSNGTAIELVGGTAPGGFTNGTTYYVVGASGNTMSLAATKGGAAINSTSTGSGTQTLGTALIAAGGLLYVGGGINDGSTNYGTSTLFNVEFDVCVESGATSGCPVPLTLAASGNSAAGFGQFVCQFPNWQPSQLNGGYFGMSGKITETISSFNNLNTGPYGGSVLCAPPSFSLPASGPTNSVTYNGPDCWAYITGGTGFTAVTINGASLPSGALTVPIIFRLRNRSVLSCTYSGTPSITLIGDGI